MHERNSTKIRLTAIGLMSGTSMDGIDAAVLTSDGMRIFSHGPAHERPYSHEERRIIAAAMQAAAELAPDAPWPPAIIKADEMITRTHSEAVRQLLDAAGLSASEIDLVGFHGQTLVHRPEQGFTLQAGDGAALRAALGIDVVDQFRKADVAAGGEGAPLAPLYHRALVQASNLTGPVAVLNLGGVGNISFISDDHELLAFDTGPGNALLDDWTFARTGAAMDRDGALAGAGRVDTDVLAALLDHPFFKQKPPKSLDRNAFSLHRLKHLPVCDGAATLCAFSARAVHAALAHLPCAPRTWIICGGGRCNPALMRALAGCLPGAVRRAGDIGWRGDMLEAEAFAYLAIRAVKALPLSLPGTTGVREPLTGGNIHSSFWTGSKKS